MTPTTILTHPGSAHKDEFLACCVLLSKHTLPIIRREPTESDLSDPTVIVVDVGHEHSPEKNNFDHHQFPKDHTPTCSLSLILKHFGVYEEARQFCAWLEPAEWFDCLGAVETAKRIGIEREAMNQLTSPIDVTVLRRFAQHTLLEPGNPIWELMKMIGDDLIDYINNLSKRLTFVETHSEMWSIGRNGESYKILFMPRTEPLPEEPSSGLSLFIELQEDSEVIGMVYPDRRGDGYGLARFQDNPKLDYTQLTDEPDVHFAHARGFVAKTSAVETDRLKTLVQQALV